MHMGELSFPLVHAFQIYEPRESFGILLSPEITPLSTKPFLPYYLLRIPRAWTMGYKDNTWFFAGFLMAFCIHLNIHRALMLILLATYPLVWPRSLLHVLWSDRGPSPGLTEILFFFFLCYYYYLFLFSSFWDFGPSWSFLTSWIGHSFVKAHGLSLLFMEWAIM